jgi:hypothetical protein
MFGVGFHLGIIGDVLKTDGCAVRAVRDANARAAATSPSR